jgi:tRNA-2-methylthio-N6-dimethylallyladenosine synthase
MRRGYTRETYLRVVENIRNAARPIALSTDIIVGFPGETGKDFEDTVSLMDAVQYDSIFSFKYSPRPNTQAFARSNEVPEAEKSRRLSLLQEQQKLIQYNRNAAYVGRTVMVLADDRARANYRLAGRTSDNKIVNFDGPDDLLGKIVPVEVTGFSPNSLKGVWKRGPVEEL